MSSAEACERLFALMDNQPSKVRTPDPKEILKDLWREAKTLQAGVVLSP